MIENSNQEPSVTAPLSTQSRSDKSNEDVLPKETSSSSTPNKQNYRKETVVSFEQFTVSLHLHNIIFMWVSGLNYELFFVNITKSFCFLDYKNPRRIKKIDHMFHS